MHAGPAPDLTGGAASYEGGPGLVTERFGDRVNIFISVSSFLNPLC
jgi:hypothetical protein